MDLGIAGRSAIVCASSRGLGRACAEALAAEGVHVVINGRDSDRVERTAAELRTANPDVEVRAVAADVDTPDGRTALLEACPEPDILVTNNAGPTPRRALDSTPDHFAQTLQSHFYAPIALAQAVIPGMRSRRFGRIVNITSAMIETPHPMTAPATGARAGLSGVMKGLQRETVSDNVTINQLMPERIDSGRQHQLAEREVRLSGITYEEARQRQRDAVAAGRLGRVEEVGAACAFLCSTYASYISGVHLRVDGGSFPGFF